MPGLFHWKVLRNGLEQGVFLFKYRAVQSASDFCRREWDFDKQPSELYIKGRNGKIQDARTYGDDPRGTPG